MANSELNKNTVSYLSLLLPIVYGSASVLPICGAPSITASPPVGLHPPSSWSEGEIELTVAHATESNPTITVHKGRRVNEMNTVSWHPLQPFLTAVCPFGYTRPAAHIKTAWSNRLRRICSVAPSDGVYDVRSLDQAVRAAIAGAGRSTPVGAVSKKYRCMKRGVCNIKVDVPVISHSVSPPAQSQNSRCTSSVANASVSMSSEILGSSVQSLSPPMMFSPVSSALTIPGLPFLMDWAPEKPVQPFYETTFKDAPIFAL